MKEHSLEFGAEDWARFLSGELGRNVRVRFGRARRQVIVAFPESAGLRVRMNQVFGRAPDEVRTAVADWLRRGRSARGACRELDQWIASILPELGPPRPSRLVVRGASHDLGAIAADLLANEFRSLPTRLLPRGVTWGRRGPRGVRRSLQLGSFDPETRVIRIHPVLDQEAVPRSFVRYVMFHELLHAVHPPVKGADGRWVRHGSEFRRREKAYPDLGRALAWERKHIAALVRSARRGTPLKVGSTRAPLVIRFVQEWLFPEAAASKPRRASARRP